MSYRKITVEDKTYEYVIGKKFTKVKLEGKSFGLYSNDEYGNQVVKPWGYSDDKFNITNDFIVTPLNVKHMILGLTRPSFETREGKTFYFMINPFESEIFDRVQYIPYSRSVYDNLSDDI